MPRKSDPVLEALTESKYANERVEEAEKAMLRYAARLARAYDEKNSKDGDAAARALRKYARAVRLGLHSPR